MSEQEETNFHNFLGHFEGISVSDTLSTAVSGYLISKAFGWSTTKTIIGTFIVGELVHKALGIETPITNKL